MTTATVNSEKTFEIKVSREISAPVAKVYGLWLDADQTARWFGPEAVTITGCEIVPEVGGVWRVSAHGPDMVPFRIEGVFHALEENRRIVQTWQHVSAEGERGNETECEIVFTETARGCRVTVTHRNIRFTPERFNDGWTQSLARIEGLFAG